MGYSINTHAYGFPLEHVRLGRMVIPAAAATVADTDRVLVATAATGPCKLVLVAASAPADILTIAFPADQANAAELAGITVTLDANSGDTLAVTGSEETGNILIKLAASDASKNTAANIEAAIRALDPVGDGHVATYIKGVLLTGVTCAAGGSWDDMAVAEGAGMTDVPFEGGGGETVTALTAQPSCPRNITATAVGTGDIGAVAVTVYGTNIADQPISETLPAWTADAAATKAGVKAFKTITSVFLPSHDGTGVTVAIGTGEILGLPFMFTKKPLCLATLNGAFETTFPTIEVEADEIEKNTVKLHSTLNSTEVCVYLGIPEA